MTRTATAFATAALTVLLSVTAEAAPPQPQPTDLTPAFRAAGIAMDRLQVFEIGGVVVIRGRAADAATAATATKHANSLGYTRVANLVQIVPPPDDAALRRAAERELTIHRGLDGCKFQVVADRGVVRIGGSVRHELQKDMAASLVRNIDGVRAVELNLDRE